MKNIKNLNDELDSLLSKTSLPSDYELKEETYSAKLSAAGKKGGFKRANSGDGLLKAAIKGGITQGKKNANNGHCKRIAKLGGDANVKSGHIDRVRHLSAEKCSIPIIQYDKNGKKIKVWKNAVEAAKTVGTTPQNINNALNPNKINKTAGGFIWKYKK